jgi:hypothetical protein
MKIVRLGLAFTAATLMVAACGSGSDVTAVGSPDSGTPTTPLKTDSGVSTDAGRNADAGDAGIPPTVAYSIGGTVSGLLGTGLVLQDNAGDDLPVAAAGTFTFASKLAAGAAFDVTVKTQPTAPAQTCTVSGASGTVASGNVTTIAINCDSNKFAVGGTVSGLVGTGLTLENNGGGDLIVNANGTFAFAAPVASGNPYAVTVKAQPGTPAQTCVVTNGSGTIAAAVVSNVTVACTTNKYTVGGTVAGLSGTGLTLQANGGDSLAVAANGTFTFATALASGTAFTVTASAQPAGPPQTCLVMGGTGTIGSANVTSVAVNCTTNNYTIGGTASGLLGTAVLQDNGGNDLNVTANGTFAFSAPITSGGTYAVTVKTQPGAPSQTCTLTNATGTVAAANVTNVTLACVTNTFAVGGTVSGLSGAGLVLEDNGGDDLAVGANGTFVFASSVASGQVYAVTVKTSPSTPSQTCTVTAGSGTVGAANITSVAIACVTNSYTVGGTASGVAGTGLVLQDNLGDDLAIPAAGTAFTFATTVLSGAPYSVTVKTQPTSPTQTCAVVSGAGTVTNGNVVGVMVNCTTNEYTVSVTTTGVVGTGLVVQDNLASDLTVNGNGTFAFGTTIASGSPYSVTVKTQPTVPSQTCTVTAPSGTVASANVTLAVACVTNRYTIGGTITGTGGGTLVLDDNGGDPLTSNADGSFTFATSVASGAAYAVTVGTNPTGEQCTVANGTGTVGAANVTSVTVTCVSKFSFALSQVIDGQTVTCSGVNTTGTYTECDDLEQGGRYFPNGITCGPVWSTTNSAYSDTSGFCNALTGNPNIQVYYVCSATTLRSTWKAHVWGTFNDNGYTQNVRCFY